MSPAKTNPNLALNESRIIADIRELFTRYGSAFVDLAAGKRSDVSSLLDFYGAPLRYIGATFHLVMKDDDAITGKDGIGGELEKLHRAHFAGSTLDKFDVKVFNARAALVEAIWLRRDSSGALSRSGEIYLVTLATEGWRITSVINVPN